MIRQLMVKTVTAATLSLAALTISGAPAFAQSGTISFTGGVNLGNFIGDPSGNTLLIDFLTGGAPGGVSGTLTSVGGATGQFSGIVAGTTGTVADLLVMPGSTMPRTTPFLVVGGYTFSNPVFTAAAGGAINYGSVKLTQDGANTVASLALTGMLTGAGLSAGQMFDGVFSTQFAGLTPAQLFNTIDQGGIISNQGVSASFTYQVSTVVPEPSTYALMLAGLAGIAFAALRRATAA